MAKVRSVELIDRDLARAKVRIKELLAERRLALVYALRREMDHAPAGAAGGREGEARP